MVCCKHLKLTKQNEELLPLLSFSILGNVPEWKIDAFEPLFGLNSVATEKN
jgi:hypothetical protein